MRIGLVGGVWRGRGLVAPRHRGVRPTPHKVREAVYDILGPRVAGASVLDLFAGSGALGLEAISRGARAVVFVDRAPGCTAAIRRSLERLGLPPGVTVEILTQEAVTAIRRLARARRLFDLILMDPPYAGGWDAWGKSLQGVVDHGTLAPSGVVVVEYAQRSAWPAVVVGSEGAGTRRLWRDRTARYGDTEVAFYQWMTEDRQEGLRSL